MRQTFESGLNMAHASEGVIIDLRDGFGGGPYIEYIDPFLRCGLGEITAEQTERTRRFESKVGYSGPAVVLINGGSRSGKELLAYCFKKTGKAVLLGERTAGYVTGGRKKRICRDSLLYYGAARINFDGKSLEGVGVEPDIIVPFHVRFAAGRDPQLKRAKEQIIELIESGH
jgi:carboxyl-terminal processing protease